jgi:hypothetical protein
MRRERAVDEAVWLRSVLALDDDTRRETAFKFLLKARLVDDPERTLQKLTAKEIPFIDREARGASKKSKGSDRQSRVHRAGADRRAEAAARAIRIDS